MPGSDISLPEQLGPLASRLAGLFLECAMTDEQVEAAAKAGWDYENIDRGWKDTPEDIKSAHRARARDMLEAAEAAAWSSDMDAAPKDRDVLVWYDHAADPYQDPANPERLTDYAALAENGEFLDGAGVAVARWYDREFEAEDEYGNGYWLPAAWFSRGNCGDYETVCNAIAWRHLPGPPK